MHKNNGCELLVGDNITANNQLGKSAGVFPFSLPQTDSLRYPQDKMPVDSPIRVTGQFTTAYSNGSAPYKYVFKDTQFSATSQYWTDELDMNDLTTVVRTEHAGQIAFITDVYEMEFVNGITAPAQIDAFRTGTLNLFAGGVDA